MTALERLAQLEKIQELERQRTGLPDAYDDNVAFLLRAFRTMRRIAKRNLRANFPPNYTSGERAEIVDAEFEREMQK